VTYNEGFLGQENDAYQAWILDKQHWGGAIELSILSQHYGRVICAYDIQTKRCDRCVTACAGDRSGEGVHTVGAL
jgi:ubiquitin thioesterase OTU1